MAKQLDGRAVNDLIIADDGAQGRGGAGIRGRRLLAEAQRYKEQGADKPFLDVWFADAQNGYVVGAYNLIFAHDDGGKTWQSWFDRTDNPRFLNLYSIRPAAGELFIAGEGGPGAQARPRGAAIPRGCRSPYNGSFFGVDRRRPAVVVFGLRGNVFRSDDGGATWTKVDAGLPATIVGGHAHRGRDTCSRFRRPRRGQHRRRPHLRQVTLSRRRCRSPESPMPARASLRSSGPRGAAVVAR